MRIGIFGGSFNPVHAGHLKIAQEAFNALNLERVIFVPAHQNPLKASAFLKPASERLAQLKEAIRPYPHFEVSNYEITKKGVSYTVDTLKFFKKKYPQATLYFLTGADSIKTLARWKNLNEIKRLCQFVIASRPGYALQAPEWALALPMDSLDVSSTEIRKGRKQS